jgi:hypothetical protein
MWSTRGCVFASGRGPFEKEKRARVSDIGPNETDIGWLMRAHDQRQTDPAAQQVQQMPCCYWVQGDLYTVHPLDPYIVGKPL